MRSVLLGASAELRQVFAAHLFRLGAFYYVAMACMSVCIGVVLAPLQGRPGLILIESAVVPLLASIISLRRSRIAALVAVAVGFAYLSASIFGAAYASTDTVHTSLMVRRALAVLLLGGNFGLHFLAALRPTLAASPSVHAMDPGAALRNAVGDALAFALRVSWRTAITVYLSGRLVRDYTAWDVYAAVEQNLIANVFFCTLTRFSRVLLIQLRCQPLRELDSVPVLLSISASLSAVFSAKAYTSLLCGYSEMRRLRDEESAALDEELAKGASVRFGPAKEAPSVPSAQSAGPAPTSAGSVRASKQKTMGKKAPLLSRLWHGMTSLLLAPFRRTAAKRRARGKAPAFLAPFSSLDYYLIDQFCTACSRVLRLSEWPALTTDYSTMVLSRQARELSDSEAYRSRAWMAPALSFPEAKLSEDLFPMHVFSYQESSPVALHFFMDALVHCMLCCAIRISARAYSESTDFYCGLAGKLVQTERMLHNVYAGMPVEFCGIDGLLLDRAAMARSTARSTQAIVSSRQDLDAPIAGAGFLDRESGYGGLGQHDSALLIQHNRTIQKLLPAAQGCTVMLDPTGDDLYEVGKTISIAPQPNAQHVNFDRAADPPTWKGKKLVFLLAFLIGGYPLIELNSRKDLEQELTVWSVLLHALGLDAETSARKARRTRAKARRAARRKLGKTNSGWWIRLYDPLSAKLSAPSPAVERAGTLESCADLCAALSHAASALSDVVASTEGTYMYQDIQDITLLTLRLSASSLYAPGNGFGPAPGKGFWGEREIAMRTLRLASQRLIE